MASTDRTRVNGQPQTRNRVQNRTRTPAATGTITQTSSHNAAPVLRLRGAPSEGDASRRRIQWAEDVVDNEGMGRKSSKVCCIYHAPKGIDESSDESSSDSDDSSSDDDGAARPAAGRGPGHEHGNGCGHGPEKERKRSPNAYEKLPKQKGAKGT